MRDKKRLTISPVAYILFFLIGITIFLYLTNSIKIPIYETLVGKVKKEDDITIIQLDSSNNKVKKIYYYINRDEWIDKTTLYDDSLNGYVIDKNNEFINEQTIQVDIQKNEISLFDAIFKYGGNI